ncbi:cation:proton antiporter [Azohydromonas caseinilytica]|uniref:Sodium:proton antiporter n=1 Tax=Azohydromonas caseinilytica TaxID=2728836 RepID=A0A848FHH2_9BURK|nr:cation:proton antiporter [Azohydromonas caseinilytica]NML18596.1 sodium:proton antiporter [Azohydromonas caseinilytica]
MFATWCLLIGSLLVAMGLSNTLLKRLPVSAAALYLAIGYILGPEVAGFINLSLTEDAVLIEHLTEIAVLVSLFAVGLRLRVHLDDPLWRAPVLLASVAMLLTIAFITALGYWGLGLSLGAAVLLAAVLAPTDPVLASEVQVEQVGDRDRLRFSLTGEGGLNDGAAFPFVMLALGLLGLHELGTGGWRWWLVDVLWAVSMGLLVGWFLGTGFARAVAWLRRERMQALGMESFLSLGLIALAYGVDVKLKAYGFLAVFTAGLAMRHVEHLDNPEKPSDETVVEPEKQHYIAPAALEFALDLEKLVELTVMLLVGSLLSTSAFTWQSVGVAAALLLVARPVAVWLTTRHLRWTPMQRALAAWFGVRGVGSMYYLAYAVSHGAFTPDTPEVADAVLVTIALSVLLHGSTATPIMAVYQRRLKRRQFTPASPPR